MKVAWLDGIGIIVCGAGNSNKHYYKMTQIDANMLKLKVYDV